MKLPSLSPRKYFVPVGFEAGTDSRVDIALPALFNPHCHILGPPGVGKTRLLFSIFQQLARLPEATIILFNVKGDLGIMCRDWCIAHGLTSRVIFADPAAGNMRFNPLAPNHLPVATHAKLAREAIRSSTGQASFDLTQQLGRMLFLGLYVAREFSLTLAEAVSVLRPESELRQAIIPAIRDPFVREALQYVHSLRGARQDELTASTLARLESFVLDETIRRIVTDPDRSIDLGKVMEQKQILILNFEQYRPLALDDIKLLGRLILNSVLANAFARPSGQRSPVYLLIDECQNFVTADLCRALDQGRELGLFCLLAHQYLAQLREE